MVIFWGWAISRGAMVVVAATFGWLDLLLAVHLKEVFTILLYVVPSVSGNVNQQVSAVFLPVI